MRETLGSGSARLGAGGTLYIPDRGNGRIRKVEPGPGNISTVVNNGEGPTFKNGVAADGGGNAVPEPVEW